MVASARHLAATLAAALLLPVLAAVPAAAAAPPEGAAWSETFIATADGESLHVDVLHPVDLPDSAGPRDVILVVSPYLGIGGDEAPGPVNRFYDFFEGAYDGEGVFANGWSVVQVSLRGTGGSSGCLDILGPGEQLDVATAVAWVDAQPWADGVAMYGKSYDANTGVVAAALRPPGLDAIIAQAIAPDRYRGSYSDRVRLLQSLAYPAVSYGSLAEGGFSTQSEPQAITNSVAHSADCQVPLAEHYLDDEQAGFWRVRDFVERAEGSTIPTFVTAGYLDVATNIGAGAIDFYNALAGPKALWVGWWDHVRGNDRVGDRAATGREGFFDEVEAFLEHHVRGVPRAALDAYPATPIAAQGSDGTWHAEESFPPADATPLTIPLNPGSYVDDATNNGSGDSGAGAGGLGSLGSERFGHGIWTFGEPLAEATQVVGIPAATVAVDPTVPRTNVAVNVYDVDPESGLATMVTRGAATVDAAGEETLRLFPTDWTFAAGHRIGVLVSGANAEAFIHVPTQTTVPVSSGRVTLDVLPAPRLPDLAGESAPRLERYLADAPFDVSEHLGPAQVEPQEAVHSPNMEHVANVRWEDALRRADGRPVDGQGGTDVEFATIAGRDHAFAGTYRNGLQVLDITDPEAPALVASYDCRILQGDVQVFTREERTYVTYTADSGYAHQDSQCFRDAGVAPAVGTLVIDVTAPAAPRAVGFVSFAGGSHNQTVHPGGEWMYNSNSGGGGGRIEVISLEDVTAPQIVTRLDTATADDSHDITFSADGTRAYSAALDHTLVIDTSDPADPVVLGTITDPAITLHHQADPVTIGDRTYVIINDELNGAGGNEVCPGGGLHVYDVTGDLASAPEKVGAFFVPDVTVRQGAPTGTQGTVTCTSHVFRIDQEHQLLTIAWFGAGVRVVDLSGLEGYSVGVAPQLGSLTPGMQEVGYYRFPADSDAWSAKPWRFDADGSAYVFANDQTRGFDVYGYDATAPGAEDGGLWLTPVEALARASTQTTTTPGPLRPYCDLRARPA